LLDAIEIALRALAGGVEDWPHKMKMALRSGVTPEGVLTRMSLRISQVGEHPPPAISMRPIGIQQGLCTRMSLQMADVGDRVQLAVAMRLVGIQQRLRRRAFFRTADVRGRAPLGGPRRLVRIRRILRPSAFVRTSDVSEVGDHPPSSVPMIPIEYPHHMGLGVARQPGYS
jgi:hypothetical protein